MKFTLKIVDLSWLKPELGAEPRTGQYIKFFDVARHNGKDPFPMTDDVTQAAQWDDASTALAFWKTQSIVRPFRPDGKPNRPLTALSVELHKIP